ncbi:hypothetical protein AVEN_178111-1 [Araneus ventricosus]|uniref:Uncharacterized protein n=1 Tax=Araneus ventricosus TaxID=182803 RepID=A0A4Y2QMJ4_ARAVE|nr:hypothetical protein AVEN_178111-1 [Araneus ventricosus]
MTLVTRKIPREKKDFGRTTSKKTSIQQSNYTNIILIQLEFWIKNQEPSDINLLSLEQNIKQITKEDALDLPVLVRNQKWPAQIHSKSSRLITGNTPTLSQKKIGPRVLRHLLIKREKVVKKENPEEKCIRLN